MSKRVLIFDSGIGGLSVYQEIHKKIPQAQYIYAFDNAAFPYGELVPAVLIERTCKIVLEYVELHDIDLVVIACNTASTIVLPTLRSLLNIPVVGVVPAIKPAALASKSKTIGLLATPATITRAYTHDLIEQFASDSEVLLIGSTRLVEIAEEKLIGKEVDLLELKSIIQPWIGVIDCIVLGCTHFPFLKDEIKTIIDNITIIDSGEAIARRVVELLGSSVEESMEENVVYCSATPVEAAALDNSLKQLGLSAVKLRALQSF
ncbi:glutamate racemase [Aliivibrio kagoshimensis]|uniref:glutamate racemase n=1 Tax=Aliivibrio kagoshimensis TaxID=2910230 RepID=UPI003D0F3E84